MKRQFLLTVLIIFLLSLFQGILFAQQDHPRADCCFHLWSTGCYLGWATALFDNTQIRERWSPFDQTMVDQLNGAIVSVRATHATCSKMNMAWPDAESKAQWLAYIIGNFSSNPSSFNRGLIYSQIANTYGWGSQLMRQVYQYGNQQYETHLETCAEKYFKLGFTISCGVQYYRHGHEALQHNQYNWYQIVNRGNSYLNMALTVMHEYGMVRTGYCANISTVNLYNRLYSIVHSTARADNIQYQINLIDQLWRDLAQVIRNGCTATSPTTNVPGSSDNTPGVSVNYANQNNFIGAYKFKDPRRSIKEYNGTCMFSGNSTFKFTEYINGKKSSGTGKWNFNPKTLIFIFNPDTNAYFSGTVSGNTRNFTISGKYGNGTQGKIQFYK
jgi:hypothetical protein